jgi:hypothetical protein
VTQSERRIVVALRAGGSLSRPHLSTRSYLLNDPAQPLRTIWVRPQTIDRMLEADILTCEHGAAPIRLGPAATEDASNG